MNLLLLLPYFSCGRNKAAQLVLYIIWIVVSKNVASLNQVFDATTLYSDECNNVSDCER